MAPLHNHRQPFSAERVIGFLDKLTSPIPAALLTFVLLRRFKHVERHSARWIDIKQRYPLLIPFLTFVAIKHVHRALNRLALNNGWQRIRPRWSEEIVVITGGERSPNIALRTSRADPSSRERRYREGAVRDAPARIPRRAHRRPRHFRSKGPPEYGFRVRFKASER